MFRYLQISLPRLPAGDYAPTQAMPLVYVIGVARDRRAYAIRPYDRSCALPYSALPANAARMPHAPTADRSRDGLPCVRSRRKISRPMTM